MLRTPDYSKSMYIISFFYFHIVAIVLLQKNKEGFEKPISFFSKCLQLAKLKYDINEEKAYALVKSVKDFRCYLVGAIVVSLFLVQ